MDSTRHSDPRGNPDRDRRRALLEEMRRRRQQRARARKVITHVQFPRYPWECEMNKLPLPHSQPLFAYASTTKIFDEITGSCRWIINPPITMTNASFTEVLPHLDTFLTPFAIMGNIPCEIPVVDLEPEPQPAPQHPQPDPNPPVLETESPLMYDHPEPSHTEHKVTPPPPTHSTPFNVFVPETLPPSSIIPLVAPALPAPPIMLAPVVDGVSVLPAESTPTPEPILDPVPDLPVDPVVTYEPAAQPLEPPPAPLTPPTAMPQLTEQEKMRRRLHQRRRRANRQMRRSQPTVPNDPPTYYAREKSDFHPMYRDEVEWEAFQQNYQWAFCCTGDIFTCQCDRCVDWRRHQQY
jgi:hypothetical protein